MQQRDGLSRDRVVEAWPAEIEAARADVDGAGRLEGIRRRDVGSVDLPDVGRASRRRASEIDGRGPVSIALAVDDGERQPTPSLVTSGRGVETLDGPEILDV